MEKKKPHHDLSAIKAVFAAVGGLRMTRTATQDRETLGITLEETVKIIQGITSGCFYKSMTSHESSKVWQDVYHVPREDQVLYVKFTGDAQGFVVLSFKEK